MTESENQALLTLLPALRQESKLAIDAGDVVVHAPGFEDRTMAVTQAIMTGTSAKAILMSYEPANSRNRLADVRQSINKVGVQITDGDILNYNRFEPGDFEQRLSARLTYHRARRVLVDISTMSKLLIILVLNVARTLKLEVTIFYAEAESYGPTEASFNRARETNKVHQPSLQVFTGVHGVVRVDSLASVAMQGHQTAALVFMSFNDALTQVLLNTAYPGRLFLINGRPPVHSWREQATAWIHDQVRREWEIDNPVEQARPGEVALPKRSVSTLDYRETVLMLLDLYWALSASHRILLAPAGSKLQAVGCSMVKALHPDIHIEYPSHESFTTEYSTGIGKTWVLALGNLAERLKVISETERHQHLEISLEAANA
ncbi:MAG: hypothetical protein IH604_15980 [Burkholderiales bacterium]|nr:hypothetical protein [Burkholderiales bacterium]